MSGPEANMHILEKEPMRSREEALVFVLEDIKKYVPPEVIRESVQTNPQVEAGGKLHTLDLERMPECGCVVGAQQIIGDMQEKLDAAREKGTMPHEEYFYGLILNYFEGLENEVKPVADLLGNKEETPEVESLVEVLDTLRENIVQLRTAANDEGASSVEEAPR